MSGRIVKSDVPALLLAACPTYRPNWEDSREYNVDDQTGERLHYLDAADLCGHLVRLLAEGKTGEFGAFFSLIERLHLEGDDYVQNLATIGYLEGLQLSASHHNQVQEQDFVRFLGPESRRWWNGLVAFWQGRLPAVEPLDD